MARTVGSWSFFTGVLALILFLGSNRATVTADALAPGGEELLSGTFTLDSSGAVPSGHDASPLLDLIGHEIGWTLTLHGAWVEKEPVVPSPW